MPSPRQSTEKLQTVIPVIDEAVTITEIGVEVGSVAEGADHKATLMLLAGPVPGQVYSLSAETIIGRDTTADIKIDDPAVSRHHARVIVADGGYVVVDLGSSNGVLVSGKKVERHELVDGDRIQLGPRVILRFAILDETEEQLHRQLFESSTRDPLTRAYNKKYINERLAAEVAHAQRHQSSLELIVFDLDRFKQVNDVHGHLVGDAVLRGVADRVHALIRAEDVFGRFGGEEFVLLTRDCDSAKLAERIRVAISQLAIPTDRGEVRVTVSLGVARWNEIGADGTATRLLDVADQRLLRAKRAGRNQVCSKG